MKSKPTSTPSPQPADTISEPQPGSQGRSADEGRFAYEGLDRLIHERARLGVLTSLVANPRGLTFTELKQLCALTDGNLSRHLQPLEKEGIVEIIKKHEKNRPLTLCRITSAGRQRYLEYLATLEQVIRDAEQAAASARSPGTLPRTATP
jgi:DNA-binding MarR family transcriptional regulator